ncbi:alpha/beta hydrolase [Dictyobacter arantiisoli]|uniref:Alpha/beta hydrolase n=1 Tax=Dictyobacter arantiisoli TaxID=2014874 RepID=A0A5A5TG70_9CHLR|nr:alpha/beta hydrolase [Dictyobacter arantiisoli]GCF10570.1 alpha/beta hydrolase [Dictyobacter arantiisoli]
MPLDPQVEKLLEHLDSSEDASSYDLSLPELRQQMNLSSVQQAGEIEQVEAIENLSLQGPVGEFTVRLYTPAGKGPLPILVYFHGGGWVFGNLETHDALCRTLANQAACIVIAVDYHLSPEYKFPIAIKEGYNTIQWIADQASSFNGDASRIAIAGDSAGGNLAAAVALMIRDKGNPKLAYQVLIYPLIDYYRPFKQSYLDYGEDYYVTRDELVWHWQQYLSNDLEGQHPYASPLRSPLLTQLPPTLVITAEYDPVRDEGELYARRLQESGVPTHLTRYDGMIHSFFRMTNLLSQARDAQAEVCQALRQAFAQTTRR